MTIHTPDDVADIADQMAFVADGTGRRLRAAGRDSCGAWACQRHRSTCRRDAAGEPHGSRAPRGNVLYPLGCLSLSDSVVAASTAPSVPGQKPVDPNHDQRRPLNPLTPLGGEFRAPDREAAFQAERLADTLQHMRDPVSAVRDS